MGTSKNNQKSEVISDRDVALSPLIPQRGTEQHPSSLRGISSAFQQVRGNIQGCQRSFELSGVLRVIQHPAAPTQHLHPAVIPSSKGASGLHQQEPAATLKLRAGSHQLWVFSPKSICSCTEQFRDPGEK